VNDVVVRRAGNTLSSQLSIKSAAIGPFATSVRPSAAALVSRISHI